MDTLARKRLEYNPRLDGEPGLIHLSDGTIRGDWTDRRLSITARCNLPPGYKPRRLLLDFNEWDALTKAKIKRLTIHLNGVPYWAEMAQITRYGRPVLQHPNRWSFPIRLLYPVALERYHTEEVK